MGTIPEVFNWYGGGCIFLRDLNVLVPIKYELPCQYPMQEQTWLRIAKHYGVEIQLIDIRNFLWWSRLFLTSERLAYRLEDTFDPDEFCIWSQTGNNLVWACACNIYNDYLYDELEPYDE